MGSSTASEVFSHPSVLPRDSEKPAANTTDEMAILATRLTWIFLTVGIAARSLRYLLKFPLWGDECMLAENLLTRDAVGILAPLSHGQVAPLGFLETVRSVTQVFGFNEWSLRLVAFAASVLGLLAMRRLALRMLPPVAAIFAVAFLATAYYPVRHAAEVKPYSLDLAWTVFLLWFAEHWCRAPQQRRWLYFLIVLTPVALLTSFTAVFVTGGICLGLLAHAFRRRSFPDLLLVTLYGVVLLATFAVVYRFTATNQYETNGSYMRAYWQDSFPPSPVRDTVRWIVWMLETHSSEMFAYPIGGNHGGSTVTLLAALIGVVQFWRRGERWFVITCAGTFGLGYLAAAFHRYPYGDNERLVQYLGPLICLLAGAGSAWLIDQVRTVRSRRTIIVTMAFVLCLGCAGSSVRDIIRPYKFRCDLVHCGFARWFWNPERDITDTYCVRSDLGYTFWPKSWHPHYVCYQRIYSPKFSRRDRVRQVSELRSDRPANIVVYSNEDDVEGGELWDEWMAAMLQRFKLVDSVDHRVLVDRKKQEDTWGHYRVYRFVPKTE